MCYNNIMEICDEISNVEYCGMWNGDRSECV